MEHATGPRRISLSARRIVITVAALAIVALAAAPASAAPQLIEGSVSGPAGAAAAATSEAGATVFLNPSTSARRGSFRAVGYARVRDGSFRVTTPPSPLLRRVAARQNGWVNLLLLVRSPAGRTVLPFTRKLEDGDWVARPGSDSRSPSLQLEPWAPGGALQAEASQRADCEWVRSRRYYRYTRVGQLHQWDGFRSTYRYATGSQADSTIGGAVSYGYKGFEARGESTVTKSSVSEKGSIFRPNTSRFSRYVQTRFSYSYLYLKGRDCNRGPDDITRVLGATRHVGGSYYKPYNDAAEVLDGSCHTIRGPQRLLVAPKSTEYTLGGEAKTVQRGVTLLGVTLWSQSGWSRYARSSWRNAGTVTRAICSVTGEPNTAPVTYVGGIVRGG